nr:hypothetical protein GCM10020092_079710 [Actinoplanes digitatis]
MAGWSYIHFQPGWTFNRFSISRHRKNRAPLSAPVSSVFAARGSRGLRESVAQITRELNDREARLSHDGGTSGAGEPGRGPVTVVAADTVPAVGDPQLHPLGRR